MAILPDIYVALKF